MIKVWVRILLFLILTVLYMTSNANEYDDDALDEASVRARYVRLFPDFVTNLKSSGVPTYANIRVEMLAYKPEQVELIKKHEPLLRDEVLKIFNHTPAANIIMVDQREKVAEEIKVLINNLLKAELGIMAVDQVALSHVIVERQE